MDSERPGFMEGFILHVEEDDLYFVGFQEPLKTFKGQQFYILETQVAQWKSHMKMARCQRSSSGGHQISGKNCESRTGTTVQVWG